MAHLADDLIVRGVGYHMGSKWRPLSAPISRIRELDCSGFAQQVFLEAAGLAVPEGSWQQREFLRKRGVPFVHGAFYPKTVEAHWNRSLLVCFIDEKPHVHDGHVWFVWQGETTECYGGHGVGRRPWDTSVLAREVDWVFVIEV